MTRSPLARSDTAKRCPRGSGLSSASAQGVSAAWRCGIKDYSEYGRHPYMQNDEKIELSPNFEVSREENFNTPHNLLRKGLRNIFLEGF